MASEGAKKASRELRRRRVLLTSQRCEFLMLPPRNAAFLFMLTAAGMAKQRVFSTKNTWERKKTKQSTGLSITARWVLRLLKELGRKSPDAIMGSNNVPLVLRNSEGQTFFLCYEIASYWVLCCAPFMQNGFRFIATKSSLLYGLFLRFLLIHFDLMF